MKKLLVTDYDDTFFTNEKELRKNIKKVKEFQNEGNIFVISTSRSWKSMSKEVKKYKITYDYICCNMGAGIFNKKGEEIYKSFITEKQKNKIEEIIQLCKENKFEVTRFGILGDQSKNSKQIIGYKVKGNALDLEELREKLGVIESEFQVIFEQEKGKLFINNRENTKEKGIEKLIDLLGLKNYKIITVGDHDVDFNMIKIYDGFRMEKSSELLMKNISKMTKSVREII